MLCRMMCALLFVAWVGERPLELDPELYNGLWRSPFVVFAPLFVPVPGIRLFAWQLLLIALAPACLSTPGAFQRRARELDIAIVVSVGSMAVTFLWGWLRGGGPYEAYYQLWRFLTALLVALLLASVIRTPRDLRALALTVIIAALIRGTLVVYFYWAYVHGKMQPAPIYMTNHDDSLLFVIAVLIVGSWALVRGGGRAYAVAGLVTLHQFYAMVLNNRRLAWVELAVALLVIYVLIGAGPTRRRVNRWIIAAVPIVLVYFVVGWGQEGAMFAPVKAFSSVGSSYDSSAVAREEEIRNLLYTMSVSGNPLLGTGWGFPYQKLTSVYANFEKSWALALYTPHNSLLGVAVFAGLVGILGIWGVVPVAAYLAARGYKGSTDPIRRTAAMVATGVLAAYCVHCYGDIGFQSLACGLILGVALAMAKKLAAWSATPALRKAARAPAGDPRTTRGALPAAPTALATRMQDRPALRRAIPTGPQGAAAQAGQAPTRRARP